MKKENILILTDEQVEKIVAAHHEPGHNPKPKPPCDLIQATTLACGEEGPCSVC